MGRVGQLPANRGNHNAPEKRLRKRQNIGKTTLLSGGRLTGTQKGEQHPYAKRNGIRQKLVSKDHN